MNTRTPLTPAPFALLALATLALPTGCVSIEYPHYQSRTGFDADRARFGGPDMFTRFRVPDEGIPLASVDLDPDQHVIVVERNGVRRALLGEEMTYHHAAQGELAGEPYLVSF